MFQFILINHQLVLGVAFLHSSLNVFVLLSEGVVVLGPPVVYHLSLLWTGNLENSGHMELNYNEKIDTGAGMRI